MVPHPSRWIGSSDADVPGIVNSSQYCRILFERDVKSLNDLERPRYIPCSLSIVPLYVRRLLALLYYLPEALWNFRSSVQGLFDWWQGRASWELLVKRFEAKLYF